MKHLIVTVIMAALISLTARAQTGVDAMAKRQARQVANQNNNRQMPGVTPQPTPAAPAVSSTPLTPGQQAYAVFQSKLLAMNTNSPATAKDDLTRSMANVAQGANKPSQATVSKLTGHLTAALNEAKLPTAQKVRLAQNVAVLLNSANTPPAQKAAMIQNVGSILQSGGASGDDTAAVTADLQAVTDEVKAK